MNRCRCKLWGGISVYLGCVRASSAVHARASICERGWQQHVSARICVRVHCARLQVSSAVPLLFQSINICVFFAFAASKGGDPRRAPVRVIPHPLRPSGALSCLEPP